MSETWPPPTDEAGLSQHPSTVEDRRSLCTLKTICQSLRSSMQESHNSNTIERGMNHSPEYLGTSPTFSFLAIEGWACSSGRFNLGKRE